MLKLQQETPRMPTFKRIYPNFLLALALGLPLAAQQPTGDYVKFRTQASEALVKGSYIEAQKLFEQALETRRQEFGENSAAYASALVDLARAYQAGGKNSADAMRLYRQALPIQESTLGPDHPDVATTLLHIAINEPRDEQNKAETQQLYQRALDIRTKAFGPSDPSLAEVLTPLARLTGEEAMYRRSLTILDASAHDSPLAAATLELFAGFLTGQNRGAEAEPYDARARQIRVARVAAIGSRRASTAPNLYRVGGGVSAPRLKQKMEPEYTDIARATKWQGTVVLQMEVGADGLAHNVQLKRGIGMGLDEKAAEAVSKWLFIPGTRDGQPVNVQATVEVNFKLM
jgi:TonB family protein